MNIDQLPIRASLKGGSVKASIPQAIGLDDQKLVKFPTPPQILQRA